MLLFGDVKNGDFRNIIIVLKCFVWTYDMKKKCLNKLFWSLVLVFGGEKDIRNMLE